MGTQLMVCEGEELTGKDDEWETNGVQRGATRYTMVRVMNGGIYTKEVRRRYEGGTKGVRRGYEGL